MRSIGVNSIVGTSAKPVSPRAWNSGFANPGFSSSTAATFSPPSPCCCSRRLLIAGLLIQRRNRRRAERSLRESEERFRVMADTAPVMVWRSGPDQGCDFFNQPWLEFRGRRLAGRDGRGLDGRRAPGRLASLSGNLHRRLARPGVLPDGVPPAAGGWRIPMGARHGGTPAWTRRRSPRLHRVVYRHHRASSGGRGAARQ